MKNHVSTHKTPKLIRCSHCGDDVARLVRNIIDGIPCWHVECANCGIRTPDYPEEITVDGIDSDYEEVTTAIDDAVECAVMTWNARDFTLTPDEACDEDDDDGDADDEPTEKSTGVCWLEEMMNGLNRLCEEVNKYGESRKGAK